MFYPTYDQHRNRHWSLVYSLLLFFALSLNSLKKFTLGLTSVAEHCDACLSGASASCDACRDSYYWADGTSSSWMAWTNQQPAEGHLCIHVRDTNDWDDADCQTSAPYAACKTGKRCFSVEVLNGKTYSSNFCRKASRSGDLMPSLIQDRNILPTRS